MSTRPSPTYKRATDSFYQLWGNLKQNVTQQSQLKAAIYNFIIVAVVAACVAVCLVLSPFLKPLLWALLVGAVLFPFKYQLSSSLKHWSQRLEKDDKNLFVGIVLAPIDALESFGEYLWTTFMNHMQLLIGGAAGLVLLHLFVTYAPKGIFCVVWRSIICMHSLCSSFLESLDYKIVIAVLVVYVTVVVLCWKQEKSIYFTLAGQSLWMLLLAYVCSFLGALQVPVLVACMTYAAIGLVYTVNSPELNDNHNISDDGNQSIFDRCILLLGSPIVRSTPQRSSVAQSSNIENISDTTIRKLSNANDPEVFLRNKLELNLKVNETDGNLCEVHLVELSKHSQSAIYFKALFFACLITILYKQMLVLCLSFVPVLIYLTNKAIDIFGFKDYASEKWKNVKLQFDEWIEPRQSALLPLCWPGVTKMNDKVHRYVRIALHESIDMASSIIVIILLILVVIFASVFCAVEIYSETITIVQLGSDVVNYTINHRPELMNMFPEGMQNSFDNVIENAYQYGRTGIETYVDEFLKDSDKEQRQKLKDQILSIWDRLIQFWVDKQKGTIHGPTVPSTAITDSIGEIVSNEELFTAAQQGLISWVKTNLGMLLEVLDSVWVIVKQNLNVITSIIGTFLSVFLGGGQAVITFLLDALIFLTALFYLLSSSDEKYYPLAATNFLGFSSGPKIAEAIEASVSSVLYASAKLALFHGLFMWFTHTIFGARVVFLPAVFAGMLAAVPFLGTYWCSIPAFLDLWLIQDRFPLGIVLVMIHFLFPTSFVDPAIYADVNGGGHAYLTGLSIAGGMFWLGWEGAIFGPILLCLLVVIFNLVTAALKDPPPTPNIRNTNGEYRTTKAIVKYNPKITLK